MEDLLKIIPGRVVAQSPHTATVEYPTDQMPQPGTWIKGSHDTVLEVSMRACPTEVKAIVRRGKTPKKGDILQATSSPTLPTLDKLWGETIFPHHTVPGGLGLPARYATSQDRPASPKLIATGHPGLDVLSPLAQGHSLVLVSEDQRPPHQVALAATSHILAKNPDLKLLFVSAEASPAWENLRQDNQTRTVSICAPQSASHGERALIMRAAQAVCQAMVQAGHEVLVLLEQPDEMVGSQRAIEDNAVAASAVVVDEFERWLEGMLSLQSPLVTVLALWAENPIRLPVPGAGLGGYLPTARFHARIRLEGDTLVPSSAHSSLALPEALMTLRTQSLSAMAAREAMSDHASIFGMDELDPEQEDELLCAQRCHEFLTQMPDTAMSPEEITSQLQTLLEK